MVQERPFKVGDRIRAQVEECLADSELIVSYQGELLRVRNNSVLKFEKNEWLDLLVISQEPLLFRLYEDSMKNFERFV